MAATYFGLWGCITASNVVGLQPPFCRGGAGHCLMGGSAEARPMYAPLQHIWRIATFSERCRCCYGCCCCFPTLTRFWSLNDQVGGALLSWRVLLTMAQSMLPGQQAAAWEALKALPIDASDGFALCGVIGRLTRTAAKWWVATRPVVHPA